jgi:hypothetical protein
MRSMRGPRSTLALLLAVAPVAGCGEEQELPLACTERPAVERALDAAPRLVTVQGGVSLAECVRRARSDAELQELGLALTGVAERLEGAAREDEDAALRLGYLIGAARRGAISTAGGVQLELARRLERSGAQVAGRRLEEALVRGLDAGEAAG